MRRARARGASPAGMTLAEVLVSLALLGLLSLAMMEIYDVSRTAFSSGTSRLQLQQRAREAMQRVSPLLVQAVPQNESASAITVPGVTNPPTTSYEILFTVPDDPFDPRSPQYHPSRIWYDEPSRRILLDEDVDDTSDSVRVVAENIYGADFTLLAENAVRVEIGVYGLARGADNRNRGQYYELETVVQLPYYSSK